MLYFFNKIIQEFNCSGAVILVTNVECLSHVFKVLSFATEQN
ncbi:hypothetical protein CPS_1675 [Colwellia psychrerythraea 34H]|uniref:Uncharacterized protein n=1 Tax=Colwellia psychrerythraea (strain 34H / ATCC BAA-681) TaxID=167879 RepID=Q484V2_COLP3|nr:hypothetical protein CPS_1675 [Colwellia psychrerythraea 34H]